MGREINAQMLWKLLAGVHAVLKRALPKNADGDQVDLSTKNYITDIRQNIRAMPLSVLDVDPDKIELDRPDFSEPLYSLLEVLETLVSEKIGQDYPDFAESQELSDFEPLRIRFPNLMTMNGVLRNENLQPELLATGPRCKKSIVKLARYINFVDLENQKKSEVIRGLRAFRSAVKKLSQDPIKSLEESLGNATRLAHNERKFIEKATIFNGYSKELFSLLASGTTCSENHAAKLHLSGFLTPDPRFELFIADCRKRYWHFAQYRWVYPFTGGSERYQIEQIVCTQQDLATPRHTYIAFDKEGMWNDEAHDGGAHDQNIANCDLTLRELILPTHEQAKPQGFKLKAQEKKTLEVLLACSLLNLDTSHWVRSGLNFDSISVRVAEEASNLLKPHITSFLGNIDYEDDENTAILSFGLLIMEMEASRVAESKEEDKSWDGDDISKDSMLKRILEEWADDVEDDYKNIATACLMFQQLSETFYDPDLMPDAKRTGAIYKYILAPLFRLVIRKFRKSQTLFPGIPIATDAISTSIDRERWCPVSTSDLILFDGKEIASPTEQNKADAKKFMKDLDRFSEKIERITRSSSHHQLPLWRCDPIRIAILDTGIDSETDELVKAALRRNRIKECCSFVVDRDSDPDRTYFQDVNGHGTHVTRLILNTAPSAEIFIAKICDDITIRNENIFRIAKAIRWAIKKKVNMISMSFGLDDYDIELDMAIDEASDANISIFAAASNDGGNKPRAYPSNKKDGVLCIHASDGVGNDGGISPTPLEARENFSTLGIAIPSKWKGEDTYISGTSFATPIAAGLAANVLEFARHECSLNEYHQKKLHNLRGVLEIVKLMVQRGAKARGGYDYVMPFHLWTPGRLDSEVVKDIIKITRF